MVGERGNLGLPEEGLYGLAGGLGLLPLPSPFFSFSFFLFLPPPWGCFADSQVDKASPRRLGGGPAPYLALPP